MTRIMHRWSTDIDYLPRDSNGERRTQREHCRARRVPDEVDGFTSDNPFFVLALTSHVNFQFKRSITPYTSTGMLSSTDNDTNCAAALH